MTNAPPGLLPINLSIRRNHVRRDGDRPSVEALIRDANLLIAACGVTRGQNWISRIVRDYNESRIAIPFGLYLTARLELNAHQRKVLAERADLRYLLSYADPTGETAVRNIMRGTS